MSVILSRESENGIVEGTFQVYDTVTFNIVYRHHESSCDSYFENEIIHFAMLYKTLHFALVFKNKPT